MKGEGLTIKNGRLINNRPIGESGISEASRLRKRVKYLTQVGTISEGIAQAEIKKNIFKLM